MPDLDTRLRSLRRLPLRRRLAALAAAIRAAEDAERDVLVTEMIHCCASRRPKAASASRDMLLSIWAHLAQHQRQSVLVAIGEKTPDLVMQRLGDPCRAIPAFQLWTDLLADEALADAVHPPIRGQLTHPAALLALMDAAATHATADQAALARAARGAIAALAAARPSRCSVGLDPHAEVLRQSADAALAHLAQIFDDHRDDAVLEAVILQSASPGPAIRGWLARRDDLGHMALRRVAKTLRPAGRAHLVTPWLGRPALAGLAEQAITRGGDATWTCALADWPLLMVPARAKRLARLRRLGEGMLNPVHWQSLPEAARRGTVTWTARATMRETDRRARLSRHLGERSPVIRHAAVRALAQCSTCPELDAALIDFTLDQDARVADASLSALGRARGIGRRRALSQAISTAQRSRHRSVRARAHRLRPVFDPFAWPGSGSARWHAPVAARALLSREPEAFMEGLRARLGGAPGEARRSALWLVQRLELANALLEELVAIALGVVDRVAAQERAKAMLLLGAAGPDHAKRAATALAHGLNDPDGRIRADAVEAIARLRGHDAAVDGFMGDDVPRVRGNAMRHGIIIDRKPDAIAALGAMLCDERMEHRRSALWVVERARPVQLAGQLADMTQQEPEPTLRARAVRCARRLLCTMDREAAA